MDIDWSTEEWSLREEESLSLVPVWASVCVSVCMVLLVSVVITISNNDIYNIYTILSLKDSYNIRLFAIDDVFSNITFQFSFLIFVDSQSTHSLIHSLTYLLIHLLTYSLNYLLTHFKLTYSLSHLLQCMCANYHQILKFVFINFKLKRLICCGMWICMYICMLCIYMLCIYMLCIYMCVYVYVCIYMCMYMCMCIYVYMYVVCIYMWCIYMYVCVCICVCVCIWYVFVFSRSQSILFLD